MNAPIINAEKQKQINGVKDLLNKFTDKKEEIKLKPKRHFHKHDSNKREKNQHKSRMVGLGDGINGIMDAWIGLILMMIWFFGFSTSTRSYNSSESPSWQSSEDKMSSHGRTRVVSIIW